MRLLLLGLFAVGCENGGSGMTLVPTRSAESAISLIVVTCAVLIATCLIVAYSCLRGRK